jgi:heterodisulfide reductase subunit A-like polyferredoxin
MNKRVLIKIGGGIASLIVTLGLAKYGYIMSPQEQEQINMAIQAFLLSLL